MNETGTAESFFALTPEIVLETVEKAGFSPTGHSLTLNSLENRVYDLKLEDDSHIIVKFYRPGRWDASRIMEEHNFLFALQEADIPVCAPLAFPDGGTLKSMNGMHVAVWPRTGGRSPDDLSPEDLQILGRTIARIHNLGETFATSLRSPFDEHTYVHRPLAILEETEAMHPVLLEKYRAVALQVAELFRNWHPEQVMIQIHGDCHRGNILHNQDGWFFLDFDDTLRGPAVQDIWMITPEDRPEERMAFLDGYREFRSFSENDLEIIPVLRAMRYIHYSAWIKKRFDDPAFVQAFPHFGTDEYWEQEVRDIQRILDGQTLDPAGENRSRTAVDYFGENPEELTNADYFWDME